MSIFSDLPDPVPHGVAVSGSSLRPKSQNHARLTQKHTGPKSPGCPAVRKKTINFSAPTESGRFGNIPQFVALQPRFKAGCGSEM
ncbi:hypothetical protein AmDm5_2554 [Acetobacter malorum]|nr:hypothetical protein AmDm5_2554 [Acetobacter malorum]